MGDNSFQWGPGCGDIRSQRDWGWTFLLFHATREEPEGTVLQLWQMHDRELVFHDPFTSSVHLIDYLFSQEEAEITPQAVAGSGGTTEAASDPQGDQTAPGGEQADGEENSPKETGIPQTPSRDEQTGENRKRKGRRKDKFTKQRADFAQANIDKSWPEIRSAYIQKHLDDSDASTDVIRRAYEREYPAK